MSVGVDTVTEFANIMGAGTHGPGNILSGDSVLRDTKGATGKLCREKVRVCKAWGLRFGHRGQLRTSGRRHQQDRA